MPKPRTGNAELKRLLRLRAKIKANTPKFIRQESWRYKRVTPNWRKAKGLDSKMRLSRKGRPASPSVGYRGPRKTRGLHAGGLSEILVYNPAELEYLSPDSHIIRIARVVGGRKRKEILADAEAKGFSVLNKPRVEAEGKEAAEASEEGT